MKTKAALSYAGEDGFKIEEVTLDILRDDEILIRIVGVGLCHTDLAFPTNAGPDFLFPAVLGHEGAGIVEAIGSNVSKVSPGDQVVLTFRSCASCDRCSSKDPAYCRTMPDLNFVGHRTDGTRTIRNTAGEVSSNFFGQSSFAGYAITYEENTVKVDVDPDDLKWLGPLGCGVQTGFGAVTRSLNVAEGSSILITGGGSVGLSAVLGAAHRKCASIVLIEPIAERRDLGKHFGATHTIDPTKTENLEEVVREVLPLGSDYAIDTTGMPSIIETAIKSLGSKGSLGLVGVSPWGSKLPADINQILGMGHTIKGILEGDSDPDEFIPELVSRFKDGSLPLDMMSKPYPLQSINQAIEDQKKGVCVKAILVPDL